MLMRLQKHKGEYKCSPFKVKLFNTTAAMGFTKNTGKSPINKIKMPIKIFEKIIWFSTSLASKLDRGSPKKAIPKALVKQNNAKPPITVKPIIDSMKIIIK